MSDEQRVMAIKSLERRTQEHLTGLSQAMGGYRGVCEAMNAQLDRQAAEIARLKAINADLLAVCEAAEKEINKIMHAAFISSTYRGRMNDIRAAAESARKIVAAAAVKVRGE